MREGCCFLEEPFILKNGVVVHFTMFIGASGRLPIALSDRRGPTLHPDYVTPYTVLPWTTFRAKSPDGQNKHHVKLIYITQKS